MIRVVEFCDGDQEGEREKWSKIASLSEISLILSFQGSSISERFVTQVTWVISYNFMDSSLMALQWRFIFKSCLTLITCNVFSNFVYTSYMICKVTFLWECFVTKLTGNFFFASKIMYLQRKFVKGLITNMTLFERWFFINNLFFYRLYGCFDWSFRVHYKVTKDDTTLNPRFLD